MECTHGIAGKPIPVYFCSTGCGTRIRRKRERTAGGNGLCVNCEERAKREAAEAGDAPGPGSVLASKRWEDVVFDRMLPLVTGNDGAVITPESRDDLKYMLGSNKKRRRGECDTEHQRRPDCMWVVRDADSRIAAAVIVEVDEDSHRDRTVECESARVHDIQCALTTLAQEEGKSRLVATRSGEIFPPQVYFLRMNPNACDAPGGTIPLTTRIEVVADRVRELLRTPAEAFHQKWKEDEQMLPHVELYYYHSKKAKHLLDHYAQKADQRAIALTPNQCPRSVEEAKEAREA